MNNLTHGMDPVTGSEEEEEEEASYVHFKLRDTPGHIGTSSLPLPGPPPLLVGPLHRAALLSGISLFRVSASLAPS